MLKINCQRNTCFSFCFVASQTIFILTKPSYLCKIIRQQCELHERILDNNLLQKLADLTHTCFEARKTPNITIMPNLFYVLLKIFRHELSYLWVWNLFKNMKVTFRHISCFINSSFSMIYMQCLIHFPWDKIQLVQI